MKILLIEDNAGDARLICDLLAHESQIQISVVLEDRLTGGLRRLEQSDIDLVLLDLGLPESEGIDTLRMLRSAFPAVPIVVLTGLNCEMVAINAVREGAQDYLVKGQIDGPSVVRAISYARERHILMAALQSWALIDELTGLYNRRGFITIASEQLKLAKRMKQGAAVTFVDLDGMKGLNDCFGHDVGDKALKATAGILRTAFRNVDVVARWGGDEFVAFTVGVVAETVGELQYRIQKCLRGYNERAGAIPPLALSFGIAHYGIDKIGSVSIEDMTAMADREMYGQKLQHRASGNGDVLAGVGGLPRTRLLM